MVVPAKRLSYSRSRKRRFQKEILKKVNLVKCKNCGELTLPHRVCVNCGFYKNKVYLQKKEKTSSKKQK
jgi:large subunit ribosomal protein L32